MDYKDKYFKYKTKYLQLNNCQIGGKSKYVILLFPDILSDNEFPKKIINKIKNNYSVIQLNYEFNNKKLEDKFNLEDLEFENIAKNIYNNLDKNSNYITIGLNQGCHICNFFSNKYKKIVEMQILLNNRRINAENYDKTIIRGQRMIEITYDKEIANKYKFGIKTNEDLTRKLEEKEKYKELIYHTIILKIREQHKKVPIQQHVKTYIFDQLVADTTIMYNHNMKDEKTKKIKDIHTIEKAIMDHYKTNIDKIKQNNNMINASKFGLVIIDYEIDILEGTIFTKNRIKKLLFLITNVNI